MARICFFISTSSLLLFSLMVTYANGGYYSDPPSQSYKLQEQENLLSTMIGVQGMIYCRSGSRNIPLQGSVARITCRAVNRYEIETAPFSFLSGATDANGYFLATLSPSEVNNNMRLTGCKAYLELSSSDTCLFPTDVNKGITGVTLASYRLVNNRKIKLFTVGPFFFTSEPESTPNGRY